MFDFKKHFKPTLTIHGGDCFNLVCLRKKASQEEEFEDLAPDIDAGTDFLKRLAPDVFLRGNHDERLWDAAKSHNPVLARFASMCIANDVMPAVGRAQMLPYDTRLGIYRVGHLKFAHGYASGINAARTMANAFGSVVFGHCHIVDAISIAGLEPRIGRCAGALCQLSMDYNRAQIQTLRQQHGFAYGFIFPDGKYAYYQAECLSGQWIFPTEFTTIKVPTRDCSRRGRDPNLLGVRV
jgi:hypothetical protein